MAPEHSLAEPAPVESPDGLPVIPFESPSKFAQWLERHHTSSPGIWLRIFKKASARKTVTYAEALDAALCYGWIDGKRRAWGRGVVRCSGSRRAVRVASGRRSTRGTSSA